MVVYIAGPYRGATPYQVERNIAHAKEHALLVWKRGHVALCPHMNTAHFDGELPDDVWMDGAMELLSRCDVVYAIPGWQDSEGTLSEIRFAELNGIKVVYGI